MSKALRLSRAVAWGVAALAVAGTAEGAQRTFVSTVGADTNPCTLAAPCRGFAAAYALTDVNGEIVVLDSGGYGPLTIAKSVTVTSPAGVYAGISVFAGDGITVAAGAAKVVLRGLAINGQGGRAGIRIQTGAGEVHIENVVVSNMIAGIEVAGGTSVRISSVTIRSNDNGLHVNPATSVAVTVRDSEFSSNNVGVLVMGNVAGVETRVTAERVAATKNGGGFLVSTGISGTARLVIVQSIAAENQNSGVVSDGAGATVFVRETTLSGNGIGLRQMNSSVLVACGANLLVANGVAQSGTINVNAAACLDQVAGGTVTNVATGTGLTGGPITTTGTIGLAATQLLPTVACAANQVPQWNGGAWICATAGGTGTVTSVGTGTGLTGGPITTSGTIAVNTATIQARVTGSCTAGNSIRVINADGSVACQPASGGGGAFVQNGNSFGATAVLGTLDNQPLHVVANGAVALRLEPDAESPRIVAGSGANFVTDPGATVSGGGRVGSNCDDLAGSPTASCANSTSGNYATVAGGLANTAGSSSSVGGGESNAAAGVASSVSGGRRNSAAGITATVGGGWQNSAAEDYAAIAGGRENKAGAYSHVGGGVQNDATRPYAAIGGGSMNSAGTTGSFASIGGGAVNVAAGNNSTIGGGENNQASGDWATIPGGKQNSAAGAYSLASGFGASAAHPGSHVFADGQQAAGLVSSQGANTFVVGASGGIHLGTNRELTTGCKILGPGDMTCTGTISGASDRALKSNVVAVAPEAILERVAALPIASWEYRAAPGIRHVGPMAQDFRAAFALGDSDTTIGLIDANGVALAAIQGLNAKLEATVATQATEIDAQRAELAAVRAELGVLRSLVAGLARGAPILAAAP